MPSQATPVVPILGQSADNAQTPIGHDSLTMWARFPDGTPFSQSTIPLCHFCSHYVACRVSLVRLRSHESVKICLQAGRE